MQSNYSYSWLPSCSNEPLMEYDQHCLVYHPNENYGPNQTSSIPSIWKQNLVTTDFVPIQTSNLPSVIDRSTFTTYSVPPVSRRRRQRTNYTRNQIGELEATFNANQYPDICLREDLAQRLGIPESRIQVWFKNRRSRQRIVDRSKIRAMTTSQNSCPVSSTDSPCDTTC